MKRLTVNDISAEAKRAIGVAEGVPWTVTQNTLYSLLMDFGIHLMKVVEEQPLEKAKPFRTGEIICFPCGTTMKVAFWGPGGVAVEISKGNNRLPFKVCIGVEAAKIFPELLRRYFATIQLTTGE